MNFLISNKKLINNLSSLDLRRREYNLNVEFSGYSNYTNSKGELSISEKEYQRLFNKYDKEKTTLEQSVALERSFHGYHKTLVITKADRNYYHKEIIHYDQSSIDYPRRVFIVETVLIGIEYQQNTPIVTKEYMYIYSIKDNINLILTRVLSSDKIITYHAKLELNITNSINISLLESISNKITTILYKTIYTYTLSEYKEIVRLFNSLNKNQDNMIFDTRIIETPRNLKKEDLIKGGLIENKETTYWITHKIDGIRSFLIIYNKNIWLVEPKYNGVRKITHIVPVSIGNIFNKMEGIIIDGTIVKNNEFRLNNGKNEIPYNVTEMFYVYDILSSNSLPYITEGTNDITKFIKEQRYNTTLIKSIGILFQSVFKLKQYKLGISFVDVIALNKHRNRDLNGRPMDTLSLAVYEMLERQTKTLYPTSGLIFRPGLKSYGRVTANIKDRILTRTMESCKWERLTVMKIYLRVKKQDDVYALYSSTFDDEEEFIGTNAYPFNTESMLDYNHPLFTQEDEMFNIDNKVVEFRWENKKLSPFKIHHDRKYANSSMVALNSWILMLDPIKEETLLGQDNTFFVYQQERLRKKLYKKAASNIIVPHLLDLYANDFNVISWKDYGRTIALVTPNTLSSVKEEVIDIYSEIPLVLNSFNAQEIDKAKIENKRVILLNVSITDTITILQTISEYLDDKVDVISSMYDENWLINVKTRKLAIKTISEALLPGGIFIYLVFNSENLEKTINTQMDTLLLDNKPFFYDRGNLIEFNLDTIPEIEKYYGKHRKSNTDPVTIPKINLDLLILDLAAKDFNVEINLRSDGDRLLHFKSYLISSLFNFGLLRKSNIAEREILLPIPKKLKKAYVFLLMIGDSYLPGILTTANSLKLTGSKIDRICMVTPDIDKKTIDILTKSKLFTKIENIKYLQSTTMEMTTRGGEIYYWMNRSYTKWQCLNMTEYDRVFFLDADLLIIKNIDHLFELDVPAATFSYTRIKYISNGTTSIDINAEFPHAHGATVDYKLIIDKIKEGTTFTASIVILKPDAKMYNDILKLLKRMKTNPKEVLYKEIPKKNYSDDLDDDEEVEYTITDIAGTDERSLAYVYSNKKQNWTNIHPRFNLVANKSEWIVKPGSNNESYYTPSIIHYIQKIKPWDSDRLVNKQDYITTYLWYYVFTELLDNKNVKLESMNGLITKKRYTEITHMLESKRSIYSFYRYRYIPLLHRYAFPWVNNIDFDPWNLKWRPGERPKLEKTWSFDPNTVFIINSTKYPDQYQRKPGRAINEILPDVRISEFKELSLISNWRYILYIIATSKNGIPVTELDQRILSLTKNSVLANYRNPDTGHFGIDGGMWSLMNYRHRLNTGLIKKKIVNKKVVKKNTRVVKKRVVRKRRVIKR